MNGGRQVYVRPISANPYRIRVRYVPNKCGGGSNKFFTPSAPTTTIGSVNYLPNGGDRWVVEKVSGTGGFTYDIKASYPSTNALALAGSVLSLQDSCAAWWNTSGSGYDSTSYLYYRFFGARRGVSKFGSFALTSKNEILAIDSSKNQAVLSSPKPDETFSVVSSQSGVTIYGKQWSAVSICDVLGRDIVKNVILEKTGEFIPMNSTGVFLVTATDPIGNVQTKKIVR